MADNTRDVKLRVGVETAGSGELRQLAGELGDVGAAGGAAAPQVQRLAQSLADAKDSTEEFRQAEAQARSDLTAQRRALEEKRDALARLKLQTAAAVGDERAHAQAVQAAKLAIVDQRAAIRAAQAALEEKTAATRKAQSAEASVAAELKRASSAYRETQAAAQSAASEQARAQRTVSDGLREIQGQLSTIRNLAGAAIGGQFLGGLIGDVSRTADAYSNLAARIRLVTGEGASFDETFQGVFDVATRTNSAVDETGTLFVRLAQAGKQIGLTNREALALTETINQAIQISGASAESSQAAIVQLVQGLQSGVLRGEEFNSVMEQAPRLAQALAAGLGVTTGELRKLAEAGLLTSQTVIGALRGQASAVEQEFAGLPATVGRALQNLSTEWTRYVGEVDKANGVSATAAGAINAVGRNLETIGALLLTAGKAWVAYKALNLAQTFLEKASAIRAASVALEADTVATAANTAAKRANAAASAQVATGVAGIGGAAVQSTGLMSGLLAAVSRIGAIGAGVAAVTVAFSLLSDGIRSARAGLVDLFEWLDGTKQRTDDLAIAQKADAEAARAAASEKAALAQQMQLAAEKALNLTTEAKALVAEFEQVRQKGGSVADALEKVTKWLELGDLSGIATAGAALDALAQKGQITGQQVRESLATALSGVDLGIFEAQARAAFDGSEQGARRLQAALDAIGDETLRRVGSSADELRTGFSRAANSAINDVDSLARKLTEVGATAADAGRLIAASLNKAVDAASTERAVQAVIDRYQQLGRQGLLTGDQLAAGLDKARAKLDELTPGVSSLDEAFKQLGLRAPAEMNRIADVSRQAWDRIRNDGTVALSLKQEAFKRYADAAIAANNGVASSELKVQGEMVNVRIGADDMGRAVVKAGNDGTSAMDRLAKAAAAAGAATAGALSGQREINSTTGRTREERLAGQNAVDNTLVFDLIARERAGTLTKDDLASAIAALDAAKQNRAQDAQARRFSAGAFSLDHQREVDATVVALQRIVDRVSSDSTIGNDSTGGKKTGSGARTIRVEIGGRSTSVNVASDADARALESLLNQVSSAASRAG